MTDSSDLATDCARASGDEALPVVERVRILASAEARDIQVDVVELRLADPVDHVMREETDFRLELSLTPRFPNTRVRFADRWPAHRFEKAGRLFLLPPRQDMRIHSDPGGTQRMVICRCSANLFRDVLGQDFKPSDRLLEASSDVTSVTINRLVLELGAEASRPGFARELIMEGMAMQLAGLLVRDLLGPEPDGPVRGGLAAWRLRLIEERVAEIGSSPSLAELAALCRISPRQLARGFRMSKGVTIGRYVAQRRLECARDLLARGESVKSVAYTLGFASPSSFGYVFKRSTGFPPKAFKA